jgi:anthranilate phosphoribosyltransferase
MEFRCAQPLLRSQTLHYNMALFPYLERVVGRESLSSEQAQEAMETILTGAASPAEIAAFLVGLRMKGETVDELVGFARAMRRMAAPVRAHLPETWNGEALLDTCGTGGDSAGTFNISTIAAFVVAAAGVRVAKHGNRSISSRCGSADLLEALGVRVAVSAEQAAAAIRELGIGFLFAPAMHTAMKHAHAVRTELKLRTVFNLLGPLTNPAGANRQLAGAPSRQAAELMAQALARLGLARGFVVHGSDGLDEITTTGPTAAFEIADGKVRQYTFHPGDFGVAVASAADLHGGDAAENAAIAREVLAGCPGPRRDIVLVNASAALVAAGKVESFAAGMHFAAEAIGSGAAQAKLEALAKLGGRVTA